MTFYGITYSIGYFLHIPGIVLWVGGYLIVTLLAHLHIKRVVGTGNADTHAFLAEFEGKIWKFMVVPGAALTVVGGVLNLIGKGFTPFSLGYFHGKLLLTLIIFPALTFFVGRRLKALAATQPTEGSGIFMMFHGIGGVIFALSMLLVASSRMMPW